MQITVLFPDETWRHRELGNLYWIHPYPIANLWQRQKIALKPTWPRGCLLSCNSSSCSQSRILKVQAMHAKNCLSFQWMKHHCPEFFQSTVKLCGSLRPVSQCLLVWVGASRLNKLHNSVWLLAQWHRVGLVTSTRPWQAPRWTWPWVGFAAQPKGTWLLLSFSTASHASHVYSGRRYLQCPNLVKSKGGPKPHHLVLDQDLNFQACLSPGFLLFGLP